MSSSLRRADALHPTTGPASPTRLSELSRDEDIGITVRALTDPDSPPLGFLEDADVRRARPKRRVEVELDADLLESFAEMPDWQERANEILRIAAALPSVCTDD